MLITEDVENPKIIAYVSCLCKSIAFNKSFENSNVPKSVPTASGTKKGKSNPFRDSMNLLYKPKNKSIYEKLIAGNIKASESRSPIVNKPNNSIFMLIKLEFVKRTFVSREMVAPNVI